VVVACVFVALGVLELVFFLSDDTYRADGTSNWAAYEGAHRVVVAAVIGCVATAISAALHAFGALRGLVVVAFALGSVALLFVSWGMTLN
jgi:hypothetical protein